MPESLLLELRREFENRLFAEENAVNIYRAQGAIEAVNRVLDMPDILSMDEGEDESQD